MSSGMTIALTLIGLIVVAALAARGVMRTVQMARKTGPYKRN